MRRFNVSTLYFQGFEIQADKRLLVVGGQAVKLGARAYDVLMVLVEQRDRVVSKNELLERVWPKLVVEENNLQVQISTLRRILGAVAISTIPGRGYRFAVQSIEPVAAADDATSTPSSQRRRVNDAEGLYWSGTSQGNLPPVLPPLYGRDADVQSVCSVLKTERLVTLCGAGGIGKTRVAQAVAHQQLGHFRHGAWMVELAPVSTPALVCAVIAQVLGLSLDANGSQSETLAKALQSRSLLLVLDNCEHLLDAVSEVCGAIAAHAPGVRVLVTSQELLRVSGECVIKLPPLAVPQDDGLANAADFGAVALFVARVKATVRHFELAADNVQATVEICRQLDGLALAIELAAARVSVLGVTGVRARLGERFRLLTGGARVRLRRHQTLRAALDWSHHLLTPDEQKVFRRLGVFSGGFFIEGAQLVTQEVGCDEWQVLEHLSTLVDKSMVQVDAGERPRYSLLETTRAYAIEKLAEAGETDAWLARHARATRSLCERAARARDISSMWAEISNVRAAFVWATDEGGDAQVAVALATLSSVVLAVAGQVTEALQRLLRVESLVNETTPVTLAAQYWQWLGRCGIDGRLPSARCLQALERAEAMFRSLQNDRHLHACLRMRAEALLECGDLASAQTALNGAQAMERDGWTVADRMRRLRVEGLLHDAAGRYEDALAISCQALDMAQAAGIERYVLILMADMASMRLKMGQAEAAEEQFTKLAAKAASGVNEGLTQCYAHVGLIAALLMQGKLGQAEVTALECVPLLQHSGIFLARCDIFSWLMAARGDIESSARLLGASDAFHERGQITRDQIELRARQRAFSYLCEGANPGLVQQWMDDGASAKEDAVIGLLRSLREPSVKLVQGEAKSLV